MTLSEFQLSHHLLNPSDKTIYCYAAKNACSTMKFHFLRKKLRAEGSSIGDEELNAKVHVLAKKQAIRSVPDDLAIYYPFFIVRHPYSRIASAFLDKFVQSRTLPAYARNLLIGGGASEDPDDWTFADFVRCIAHAPVESLNEHWMPQYLHFIEGIDYDFIPMESFTSHPRLAELYGDLTQNVREHSLTYADIREPAHMTPLRELKRTFLIQNTVPTWQALIQTELDEYIHRVYGPDFDLHERTLSSAKSLPLLKSREGSSASVVSPTTLREAAASSSKSDEIKGLISVILPVYNVEKYVSDCMDSLAAQDDRNFELVVVDDGSVDSSIAIVKTYAGKIENLRIHKQANRGLGGARNTGVEIARGEFVTFIDSDDLVSPHYVSALRSKQQEGNFDIVSGQFVRISEEGDPLPPQNPRVVPDLDPPVTPSEKILGSFLHNIACARLYRRALLLKSELRFPERLPHEDLFFTHKAFKLAASTAEVPDDLYYWRQRSGSLGQSMTTAHVSVLPRLRQDTDEFLDEIGATTREYRIAARRNLNLLDFFRTKVKRFNPDSLDDLLQMISRFRNEIEQEVDLLEFSEIADTIRLGAVRKLLLESPRAEKHAPVIDYAFFPLRGYHLNDCVPVLEALRSKGRTALVVETDAYRKGNNEVTDAGKAAGIELTSLAQFLAQAVPVKVVVMWNDWDPLMRILAHACRTVGSAGVGWVEGINDYHDVDTGRQRNAYRRSEHIIVPGAFDAKYFEDSGQTAHVGEVVRIKSLWLNRSREESQDSQKTALINSNFSYGVLEDQRDFWVREAVEACLDAGFTPVISRHPFDKGTLYSEFQTDQSFFDAIRECTVSVQRFASGILEALACGTPVIYFNPHHEKVDKFSSPEGAYLKSNDRADLSNILRNGKYFWNEAAAFRFLQQHTGLTDEGSVAGERIAEILESLATAEKIPSIPLGDELHTLPPAGKYGQLRDLAASIGPFYGPQTQEQSDTVSDRRLDPTNSDHNDSASAGVSETLNSQDAGLFKGLRNKLASGYPRLASNLRDHSPLAFRFGQAAAWIVRAAWRNKVESAVLLITSTVLILTPFVAPDTWGWRTALWAAAGILISTAVFGSILGEVFRRVISAQSKSRETAEKRHRAEIRSSDRRVDQLTKQLTAQKRQLDSILNANKTNNQEIRKLNRNLDMQLEALVDDIKEETQTLIDESKLEALEELEELKQLVASMELPTSWPVEEGDNLKKQVDFIQERLTAGERQIGNLRYPDSPDCIVFFGHHKCASRFFRNEIFSRVATMTGARIHRYRIKTPPFHYARMDELDLCNIDFSGLQRTERRNVVMFANATQRSLVRIRESAESWKALRVIRDPRQVLVSNYFHHKGDHPTVAEVGWIWDTLVVDQPILRQLPEEEGLLYELDNISKEVIEEQIIAPFDDERILTIKLEDFSANPEKELIRIAEFLEIPDVAGIDIGNTRANPESGSWRDHFTPMLREVFKSRYGQTLIDLGYAEDLDW